MEDKRADEDAGRRDSSSSDSIDTSLDKEIEDELNEIESLGQTKEATYVQASFFDAIKPKDDTDMQLKCQYISEINDGKQNNMQEKSNVMYETAAYIDVLESKLDQMSKELTAMRKQLVEMDNKTLAAGIKEAINKSITKSQIAINDMKEKVSEVKSEMKAKAKSIVDEIKLKGKSALNRVAEFTRLTSKLAYVREGIREGIKETDKTIERINGFGHGMRNAGRQIVNSFRVLAGHEEKESSEDKKMYIAGILRSPWVGQKKVYEGMERVLNGAIDRLENLSKEMTEEKSKDNKSSYKCY